MPTLLDLMANFKSKDVLTVSATIIAGLLILFTLQSLSVNPIVTKLLQMQDDLDTKTINFQSNIQTMLNLKSELSQTKDNQTKLHIQNQIEDLQMQTWQLQAQIDGMKNQQTNWVAQTNPIMIKQHSDYLKITILIMIIPFGMAIVTESAASLRRSVYKLNETASNGGKNLLYYGAIVLMIGAAFLLANLI